MIGGRPGAAAIRSRAALFALALAVGCATPPAWERPPPPVAEGPIVPAERVHRARLDNGLEVLVLEDPRVPRLDLGVVLRRGADIEPLGEAGAVALLTDVMERGAGARDALALARAVEEIGASFSVGAGWDSVSASISGLSEDADALFDLLADVVLRPRLERGEVVRARAEQIAALEQAEDRPSTLLYRQLARSLYDEHRYGAPVQGTPESVAALDAALLRAYHERLFVPENAILYAVGDLPPAEVLARARDRFGAWTGAAPPPPGPPPPAPVPERRRVVIVDRPDLVQAQIALAHDGIARTDDVRVAASLMNTVLGGGGFLSRLLTRVRAEEGLAYSIGSGFSLRRHPGPFVISTATRVSEVGRVVGIVLAELEAMRAEAPDPETLQLVKSFNAGRFVLGLETSGAIAASLVELDVHGLPRDSLDTYRTRLNAIDADEVLRAAETLLHPDRILIVAVGPAATLAPQLERYGPVEVVSP